jgi:hypothetical protein
MDFRLQNSGAVPTEPAARCQFHIEPLEERIAPRRILRRGGSPAPRPSGGCNINTPCDPLPPPPDEVGA